MRNGKTIAKFSSRLRPTAPIPQDITNLTGLKDEDFINAPNLKEGLQAFFDFCRGCVCGGYYLLFDEIFLSSSAKKIGINYNEIFCPKEDILHIAENVLNKELKSFTLSSIVKYLKIPYRQQDCLSTALVLSKVYKKLTALKN